VSAAEGQESTGPSRTEPLVTAAKVVLIVTLVASLADCLVPLAPGPTFAPLEVLVWFFPLLALLQLGLGLCIALVAAIAAAGAAHGRSKHTGSIVRVLVLAVVCALLVPAMGALWWPIRRAAFNAAGERAAPLIDALNAFTADAGRPPGGLHELVPQYIDEIPETGLMAYGPFEYQAFEGEVTTEYAWYDLGSRGGKPMTGLWLYYFGDRDDAILAFELAGDTIKDARTDRLPAAPGKATFDSEAWRTLPHARMAMIESLKKSDIPKMETFSEVVAVLGEPTAREPVLSAPWELSIPCGLGVLNWDVFFYWPTEDYPKRTHGGSVERIGRWAYVHE